MVSDSARLFPGGSHGADAAVRCQRVRQNAVSGSDGSQIRHATSREFRAAMLADLAMRLSKVGMGTVAKRIAVSLVP